MRKLNWAILGPGWIGCDFAADFPHDIGNLYAVGSRSLERAQEVAKKYGITKAYGDYEELLRDPEVDVVYVATPNDSHYRYMMLSLQHGKHVLCEKAITVNGQQLREVKELAAQKGLVVAEAMTIFHMPLYEELSKIIKAGKIGEFKMVQVAFGSCKEYDVNNRFFNPDLGGGALLDIGTYALSFARYFLSSAPDSVLTTVKRFETGVDECSGIILKNKEDEMSVVTLTMRARMPKRGVVTGDEGYIVVDNYPRATKATIVYNDGTSEEVTASQERPALACEAIYMTQCVAEGRPNHTLGWTTDVLSIMDEVTRQWEASCPWAGPAQ
ncbi:Gfo/Idh/MocA family oxidoreductase [Oscillospiraceae bacterium MB08-C2-2]|nr:Gfo/Idh/MocA family oxidoreductase [Oscillospiraceae bacterium MB08-C2-2]